MTATRFEYHLQENTLDLTIVIPCLNEAAHIAGTLETVTAVMKEMPYRWEALVIDDGSTDETSRIVQDFIDAHPELPFSLHINPVNRGLSRSYVDGAFFGRGKYYRMVCGDDVESKETLLAVFRELGKADMIIPYYTRMTGKSHFRLGLSRCYTALVNWLSGHRIHYYNGMALHHRYNVMRWGPYSFGFGFQAELITRLLDEGATYLEVPVIGTHVGKSGINSAINLRNFLSVSHSLLEIWIRRVRKRIFQKA